MAIVVSWLMLISDSLLSMQLCHLFRECVMCLISFHVRPARQVWVLGVLCCWTGGVGAAGGVGRVGCKSCRHTHTMLVPLLF